jgi:hypothetical protein
MGVEPTSEAWETGSARAEAPPLQVSHLDILPTNGFDQVVERAVFAKGSSSRSRQREKKSRRPSFTQKHDGQSPRDPALFHQRFASRLRSLAQ